VSLSWVTRFKARHGIKSYQLHEEAGSVNLEEIRQQQEELQNLLEEYDPRDVFNMDETGLFYRMEPSKAIATMRISGKRKTNQGLQLVCAQIWTEQKKSTLW
jgi:hypothetical protein